MKFCLYMLLFFVLYFAGMTWYYKLRLVKYEKETVIEYKNFRDSLNKATFHWVDSMQRVNDSLYRVAVMNGDKELKELNERIKRDNGL